MTDFNILIPLAVIGTALGGSIVVLALLWLVSIWADWTSDFKDAEWRGFNYDYPYNPKKVIFNWSVFGILIIVFTGFIPGLLK